MFNNIQGLNFNTTTLQSPSVKGATDSEDVSIFGNNLLDDSTVKLTKEQKKAQKEAKKAERERIKNTPDGVIQGGKQGSTAGDCWLLAQMNSMSKTSWGKEALKNAITKENDGSFTVHFKGVNKDITVSAEEFKKAQRNSDYSSGDADALLLEVAMDKHFKAENINSGSIKGNDLAGEDSLQFVLTGAKGYQTKKEEYFKPILQLMGENPETNADVSATYIYYDKNQGSNGTNHVLSVQQVVLGDKGKIKEIVLKDSYSPDRTFTMSYGQFVNEMQAFGFTTTPKSFQKSGQKSE